MQIQQPPVTNIPELDTWLQRLTEQLSDNISDSVAFADGKHISIDKVRARNGDGLKLEDDGGNGIEIVDGGKINIYGQIGFPATQVPSADPNTLDDYEEGTWEATLTCATSGSYTIEDPTLYYRKIGALVFVQGRIQITGENAPSGQLRISTPFYASTSIVQPVMIRIEGHGGTIVDPFGTVGGDYIALFQMADNGTRTSITEASVDTDFYIYLGGSFVV